ncbi:MAG: glycosyltransferase [Chloroflexota bacterium]|nr:glycosyltransferase [Chloroflexota bacterium]
MRILFTTAPAYGHFNPLIPLAAAFQRQGHTVAVATSARFGPVVEAAGFTSLATGVNTLVAEFQTTMPPPKPGRPGFADIFINGLAGPMVTDLLALIPAWGADLIVHEANEFGGPTSAEILDLPHVAVGINIMAFEPELLDFFIGPEYADFRSSHSLPADPLYQEYFRYLYLHPAPPSISVVPQSVARVTQLLRPDLPEFPERTTGSSIVIAGMPITPERKTVYVTLGTVFGQAGGHPLFQTVISALQDEPLTIVITTGGHGNVLAIPPNSTMRATVAAESYIPLAEVLPRCDLVISHGGVGTILGALRYGLPQLVLPIAADQGWNAQRLSDLGAAVMLNPATADVKEVRAAVQHLLGSGSYRERAKQLQADLAAMPSPEDVAGTIVHMAT